MFNLSKLYNEVDSRPLALFRASFGLLMLISIVRFWYNGWIEDFYIDPIFHFTYYGLSWVKPLGEWTYALFIINGISAIGIMLGWRYRWSAILFFISFIYIEAMDKTTYLNHYYLVSCLSFILIFLPAHARWSLDTKRIGSARSLPRWTIGAIQLMFAIVYFYAGLAKLNSEWLLDANPLKIWLATRTHIPIIGELFQFPWTSYLFSWGGAIYDLSIVFFLINRSTRFIALGAAFIFHLLTAILFPIGIFPYVMMLGALSFFDGKDINRLCRSVHGIPSLINVSKNSKINYTQKNVARWPVVVLSIFLLFQITFPWRYSLYPGELFWTEEGYRFSWRVMLMEKAGYAQFKVVDADTGNTFYVDNSAFLTPFQEKQMATQPDFIVEYAHYLAGVYKERGITTPEVYVDAHVALNGRPSATFVDPNFNLVSEQESWKPKTWLMPFKDEIGGL